LGLLGEWVGDEQLSALPERLGCLKYAIAGALAEIGERGNRAKEGGGEQRQMVEYLPVAALLPAGRAALTAIGPKAELGFRTFKWKVGVGDPADELALLDDVLATLPSGAKLRLDANGAWDVRQAGRWLERAAERPIEFIEQPCFAEASEGPATMRRMEDGLRGLAEDYPTPIALDESLVGSRDVERWIAAGWRGVFVIKPALLGDPAPVLARLAAAKADVVFSSALETAVGARTALRAAFTWRAEKPRALGFGVWPLYEDNRYDGPFAAPFFKAADLQRLDPEAVWNALT
jgi:O-succinylbenzoate synthase